MIAYLSDLKNGTTHLLGLITISEKWPDTTTTKTNHEPSYTLRIRSQIKKLMNYPLEFQYIIYLEK